MNRAEFDSSNVYVRAGARYGFAYSCTFGHFYTSIAPGAAPTGYGRQQPLAPTASYGTVAHNTPAGPQR